MKITKLSLRMIQQYDRILQITGRTLLLDRHHSGRSVGTVTSVAPEPSDGILHGLGYVNAANATPGTQLEVSGPEKALADIIAFAQPFGPAKG